MKVLQGYDGLIFWHICFRRVTNATIGHGRPVIGGKGSDLGQFIWSNAALLQYLLRGSTESESLYDKFQFRQIL